MPYADPEKRKARNRERYAHEPDYRDKRLADERKRYATDEAFRTKTLVRQRESQERTRNRRRIRYQTDSVFRARIREVNNVFGSTSEFKTGARERHYKRSYNLTLAERDLLLAAQGGRCLLCAREMTFAGRGRKHAAVDHCHTTGRVRGILCNACNMSLGMFGDDPERLRAAAAYLEAHSSEARRADGTTGLQELANALR